MSGVSILISELESSISRGSSEQRVETLRRVTDLFMVDPAALSEAHVEVFDVVIARLTAAIETRARVDLAERLADVPNAPRGVIRSLAHDEIVVARPVLSRSGQLSDQDLVSVAVERGRDHMLAISERELLSEKVTDILVSRGDQVVAHAVAGNSKARLSNRGLEALVDKARADEALSALLSQRVDIAPDHMRTLVAIAKEAARQRLVATTHIADTSSLSHAINNSAEVVGERYSAEASAPVVRNDGLQLNYSLAAAEVNAKRDMGALSELDLVAYANNQQTEHAVCAVSILAHVSLQTAERLFLGSDLDLLLIVCRAQNWAWSTAKSLLKLRGEDKIGPRQIEKALESYDQLTHATAQRVLRFLHVREASQARDNKIQPVS
jgi:uncharacterized protein (DUF2336 family)